MQITWLGLLLFPLFLFSLFRRPHWLLFLAVFFCGFSGASVINFWGINFGLQPYQLAIIFMIIRLGCDVRINGIAWAWAMFRRVWFVLKFLIVFLIVDLIALGFGRIGPTSAGLTQFMHLLFGAVVFCLIVVYCRRYSVPMVLVEILIWSGRFVALWGLFQFFIRSFGMTYPDYLFNNSCSSNAGGFNAVSEVSGLFRISSVATESSTYAKFLVSILCAEIVFMVEGGRHLNVRAILWPLIVLSGVVVSTSSGGYIGIGVILVWIGCRAIRRWRNKKIMFGFSVFVVFVLWVSYLNFDVLDEMIFSKSESYSFLERFSSVINGWDMFLLNPIFGIGWGNFEGWDLFVKLLASTGLSGFLTFIMFLYASVKLGMNGLVTCKDSKLRNGVLALLVVVGMQIWQMAIIGFFPVYGDFWVTMGLLVGATVCCFESNGYC